MIWDKRISFETLTEIAKEWNKESFIGDPPVDAQFALDLIFKTLIDDKENYPYLTTVSEDVTQTNFIMLDLILYKYSRKYRKYVRKLRRRRLREEKRKRKSH